MIQSVDISFGLCYIFLEADQTGNGYIGSSKPMDLKPGEPAEIERKKWMKVSR
jgi:hypothetical protein